MAEAGGYEVSASTLEHKLEYKYLVRGKKAVQKPAQKTEWLIRAPD